MKVKKLGMAVIVASTLIFTGCMATVPVQLGGSIDKHSGKKVTASASRFNFMGFSPMTLEIADKALTDLQAQCDSGKVTGITNLYSRTFAFLAVIEKTELSGYCG